MKLKVKKRERDYLGKKKLREEKVHFQSTHSKPSLFCALPNLRSQNPLSFLNI